MIDTASLQNVIKSLAKYVGLERGLFTMDLMNWSRVREAFEGLQENNTDVILGDDFIILVPRTFRDLLLGYSVAARRDSRMISIVETLDRGIYYYLSIFLLSMSLILIPLLAVREYYFGNLNNFRDLFVPIKMLSLFVFGGLFMNWIAMKIAQLKYMRLRSEVISSLKKL